MNAEHPPERADLSNCDLEPIHIPASIQPHGLLMVFREPDLTVSQIMGHGTVAFTVDVYAVVAEELEEAAAAIEAFVPRRKQIGRAHV